MPIDVWKKRQEMKQSFDEQKHGFCFGEERTKSATLCQWFRYCKSDGKQQEPAQSYTEKLPSQPMCGSSSQIWIWNTTPFYVHVSYRPSITGKVTLCKMYGLTPYEGGKSRMTTEDIQESWPMWMQMASRIAKVASSRDVRKPCRVMWQSLRHLLLEPRATPSTRWESNSAAVQTKQMMLVSAHVCHVYDSWLIHVSLTWWSGNVLVLWMTVITDITVFAVYAWTFAPVSTRCTKGVDSDAVLHQLLSLTTTWGYKNHTSHPGMSFGIVVITSHIIYYNMILYIYKYPCLPVYSMGSSGTSWSKTHRKRGRQTLGVRRLDQI